MCVQNAGRSQLAQALYEQRGGEARSGGSKPAERVHPEIVEALREVGIEIEGRTPRGISRDDVEWTDLVVTMGCGDACPVLPGKRYVDWDLPDPSEMSLDEVRALRDEIDGRISRLVE